MAAQNVDLFDAYFRRADLDKDGRISGSEGVTFFQGSNLPKQVLAQIWMHADHNKTGFLGRNEFYNALKLVTVAQSKRELTPDIVKAALYGPASTKIPAPQITFAAQPTLQSNSPVGQHIAPSPQNVGLGGPHVAPNANMGQQFFPSQQAQSAKPPRPMHTPANFHPQQASITPSHPPITNSSSDWLGGVANVPSGGVSSQISSRGIAPAPNQVGSGPAVTGLQPTPQPIKRDSPSMASPHEVGKDPKPLVASGNGFMSGSGFGDASAASFSQPKQEFTVPASSASALTSPSNNIPVSTGSQMTIKSGGVGSPQDLFTQQSGGNQYQQIQTTGKGNTLAPLQSSAEKTSTSYGFVAGAGNVTTAQSQAPWPKITQSDVQKYTRVFVAVDTDRDGKISGEQARNLFLSWRLPREVLKQVWDLSDQDNDSMLSLREFFIALYLMERYREGRPLPSVLPSGVFLDEGLLPATGQFASANNNASWKPNPPGVQQTRVMPPPQQSTHADRARVPNQGPLPLADESKPPSPQKSKVPVLEKNLVHQLSEGEQNSLNSKFQDATEANKKVEELEKEIVESRQKIEFYSSKMQELILYKSRCDSRFNEITERVSADKREVESLAKKYEEKYKQRGDVASKLSIEESTFRDIQEKMNLYRAIVKIDQSGKPDAIQADADRIKLELEELMKSLNERCKTYSLRSKPTTLVELPFGWQIGIQEGTADWDESWDKFEDEGFTLVKELTVDVPNVVAPPKEKILRKKQSSVTDETEVSSTVANGSNIKKVASSEEKVSNDAHSEDGINSSPIGSPLSRNASESPSKLSHTSPRNLDNQSEHGGADSVASGEKGFDEPKWGNFDSHYDTDSLWDFNSGSNKDMDNSFFDSGDLGLPPIRTDFTYNDNNMPKKSAYAFTDSGNSPQSDTSFHNNKNSFVFDSVPSTPQSDIFQNNKTTFAFDSVPSSPQINNLFENKSTFQFDSVPSTPMYESDSFSRFDSFNVNETGQFQARDSFSRFDSFRSNADSEYGQGFFSQQDSLGRFDSFRSSRESEDLTTQRDFGRFDSIRSNRDSEFSAFDDSSDPFGSGPFKTDSQTPRRDSDSWKPF
ncbi:epidermal growth factor receptor substrate 15-like 1 isoform X2 [Impatiens glandulifera]|uniref:epidermal growth factor receptor substrate 15-like 1 isoform X2 n=1 Tax=Impatiens glandulifera TaxID=253017 RepID=UPI001FB0F488|nr:epidermal growth factor receptor substrate 15-like 1 isoform X2 [Impatiens glandulifera]